jgi:hypothetical protein
MVFIVQKKVVPKDQVQLTTLQANESRMVTKCRWVVEAINGFLKKFKSLRFTDNKSLSHIMLDYKIAAAFINQFYKPLFSDGDEANQLLIAKKIKNNLNQANTLINEIRLIKTKSSNKFIKVNASAIDDFPKLTLDIIKNDITLGSYQLEQSIGYISEHIDENGNFEIQQQQNAENKSDFKLIKALIQSRHINKKKYDVFIKYKPNIDKSEGIATWYCSCKNGKRTIGCCSHIACVILYLSNAKFNKFDQCAASFLSTLLIRAESDDEDEEATDTQSAFEFSNSNLEFTNSNTQQTYVNSDTVAQLRLSIKNSLSFDKIEKIDNSNESQHLRCLVDHIPSWGGKITTNNYIGYKIIETCTIDYFLLFIWLSTKLSDQILKRLDESLIERSLIEKLKQIIICVDANDWNKAKSIWIIDVLNLIPQRKIFSTFGQEFDFFIKHLRNLQTLYYSCSKHESEHVFQPINEFYYKFDENKNLKLNIFDNEICHLCKEKSQIKMSFKDSPCPWLIIDTLYRNGDSKIYMTDISKLIQINELEFKLLCCSINFKNVHFKSVFNLEEMFIVVDDLNPKSIEMDLPNNKISVCFYYLCNK